MNRTYASCLEQVFFRQKPISIDLAVVRGAWRVVRLIDKFINVSHNAQRTTHNAPIMENFPPGRKKSPKNGNLHESGS